MLEVSNIEVAYGAVKVLFGLSIEATPGEIHCLLGRNGAGKTTTLKAIMGHLPLSGGSITLNGKDLGSLPADRIPRHGVGYVPQGRRLFSELTVDQNLEIGLMVRKSRAPHQAQVRDRVLDIFPRLRERLDQRASTLSGGEQQMLATARALCVEPSVLLLDEPTEGLQPSMIDSIRDVIVRMRDENVAVILVEQRVDAVLSIADRVTFIEHGKNAETIDTQSLANAPEKLTRYLGV